MKVHFFATYRQIVGVKTIDVPCPPQLTVQALVDTLIARYPALRREWLNEQGELYDHVHIFVNGRSMTFLADGPQTALDNADEVGIFPPVGGG